MNFFNTLFGSLKRSVSQWWNMGGVAVYANIDTNKAITKGYLGNAAVYAIVNKDASKFSSIPKYVYDVKENEEKALNKKEALSKLLNRPNEQQSQDAFLATARAYYKVTGEYFIWLNRGDLMNMDGEPLPDSEVEKKEVLEMYILPSNLMTLIPDPDDLFGVLGYILETGSKRIKFSPASIIHGKNINLSFDETARPHLRGLPPLSPGYKVLQQNSDVTDASVRMIQNGGAKGALTNESMDNLTPEQAQSIKNVLDAKINSSAVKSAVATIPGKWNYHNFGLSSVDMQLIEAGDNSMKQLCFLLDVPYTLFDPETAFANSEWQQKNWINNSIIPAVKQMDGEFNRKLLIAFDLVGKAYIGSDFSELPELQEDQKRMAETFDKLWYVTPNAKAKALGFDAIDNPLFDEPWIPTGLTPLSQLGDDEAEQIIAELNKRNAE